MKTRLARFFGRRGPLVRSVYAEYLLENFFVTAVLTVLGLRLYLHLTSYPSVTVGGLHIAHVLWGGVLMALALVLLLSFLNRAMMELAAVIGGGGFGTFIDELGKFITSNNDYFYEPAVAIIYVAFVLLFFLIRAVGRLQAPNETECMANVYEIAKHASIAGLSPEESQLAAGLLGQCRIVRAGAAGDILKTMTPAEARGSPLIARGKGLLHGLYRRASTQWWFTGLIVGVAAIASVTTLAALLAPIEWSWALGLWVGGGLLLLGVVFWSRRSRMRSLNVMASAAVIVVSLAVTWAVLRAVKPQPMTPVDWAQLVFPAVSGVIVVIGLLLMPVSRLRAYVMFRRAVLVSIFFTQVFAFYEQQLLALTGLLGNVALLLALRYMIGNEEARVNGPASSR